MYSYTTLESAKTLTKETEVTAQWRLKVLQMMPDVLLLTKYTFRGPLIFSIRNNRGLYTESITKSFFHYFI